MGHVTRFLRDGCTRMVWIAGGLLILCAIWVSVEVIIRKVFSVSIGIATEISGYTLAIVSSWGFAFTQLERGHIRIDTVYRVCPSWMRVTMDILALVLLLVFVSFIARYAVDVLLVSVRIGATANTALATPMWLPQSLWVFGFLVFVVVLLVGVVRSLRALALRDFDAVRSIVAAESEQAPVVESGDGCAFDGIDEAGKP